MFWISASSNQAADIHKCVRPASFPVVCAGHVRFGAVVRARASAAACAFRGGSKLTQRYLYNNYNQHDLLHCSHANGHRFGVDIPLYMPMPNSNLPFIFNVAYFWM